MSGSSSPSLVDVHLDPSFVETESVESLEAAAAALQEQAALQAAKENAQLDAQLQEQLEQLVQNPESNDAFEAISHAANAPQTTDVDEMTHVFTEDQFHDSTADSDMAMVDTESTVNERIQAEIDAQVAQHTIDTINREARETRELEAIIAREAGESLPGEDGEMSLIESSDAAEMEDDLAGQVENHASQAASAVESNFDSVEDYPVMIESGAQSRSTSEAVPAVVGHAWESAKSGVESAVAGAKGMIGKLKHSISNAFQRHAGQNHPMTPQAHSFLAARSRMHAQHRAKEGGQWWLEKAPWFLPPPPEWGPMPVTMYTSYYHRPTTPAHLDYAHGIPLPHADALNLARRTYPQPPYEQSAGASFMEVASTSQSTLELDSSAVAEIADLAAQEEIEQEAEMPELIELHAAADAHAQALAEATADLEAESEADADSESDAESESESSEPQFFLDDTADKVTNFATEAVEAVEVDNLAQASPLKEELILSEPI